MSIGASAFDLSTYGLARFLNSDFLTPQVFCLDILTGHYPLSGWTLSASPYFVPDHVMLGALLTGFDHSDLAYGLFTLVFYLLLVVMAGLCIQTAVGRSGPAFLAGLLFGNVLLALRLLPGHALYLWWIGAPCCHGGVLLLGFVYLWLLGMGLRRGEIGWLPVPLLFVGLAGLCSDTLFLFQILLPAGVALFICRRRLSEYARWFRWQGACAGAALAGSLIFKVLCLMNGWFYFSRMIRHAPTPLNQWHTLVRFFSDLPHLLHDGWGFAVLLLAAAAWLLRSLPAWRHAAPDGLPEGLHGGVSDFYRVFCVASLLIMLPLPILTCAWTSANNVRYVFNWLVLPGFLLALAAAENWEILAVSLGDRFRHWCLIGTVAVFLLCLGGSVRGLREGSLRFPYPDDVAALDALLQRRGLKHGLAQYWSAKYVTALSHSGAELHQIRENGELYFWDNNAFSYYERDPAGTFTWPAYQYILTKSLDERALTQVFGEPQAKERAGRFQVWIYSEDGARRMRDVLEPAVRQKLGPLRLPRLRQRGSDFREVASSVDRSPMIP